MASRSGRPRLARIGALAARHAESLARRAAVQLGSWANAADIRAGVRAEPPPDPPDTPPAASAAPTSTRPPASDPHEAAEQMRAAMDLAVEVGNVGLWDANLDFGTYRYNSQLHAIYGLPDTARSSAPAGALHPAAQWMASVPDEDMSAVISAFETANNERRPVTYEHRVRRPDGEVRRVRSVALVQRDGDGPPHRAIGTTLDITDQHGLNEALEIERERLVLATQIAGIGVWDLDMKTRRCFWDARMLELYEFEPETFPGTLDAWVERIEPDDRAAVRAAWTEAAARRSLFSAEFAVTRKSGERRFFRSLARILSGPEGTPVRAIGCNWDVTHEREVGETLRRARDAADQANRAKGAFLANMSHEIRTPMNGVLGMAELVLATELSAEQRDFVSTIHASAEALLVVIDDILDYSKIEAGKIDIAPFVFTLRPAVAETLTPLALRARSKGVELASDVDAGCPAMLRADWNRIRQVVTNLVGNAVKFTAEGEISVRFELEEQPTSRSKWLRCTVSDTGMGIEPEMLERVFAPFDQATPGIHARYGGSGLGLAIAAQLVGLMGGEMVVRSTPAKGSTFGFIMPVEVVDGEAPVGGPRPRGAAPHSVDAAHAPVRVLVAEDNRVNQRVIQAMLERCGHVVRVVANGLEAVEAVAKESFDAVLMDIEMPEMDGLEATSRIRAEEERARSGRIPIVALTAHAMAGDRERIVGAGVDDYLTKPIGAVALVSALDKALRSRQRPDPDR